MEICFLPAILQVLDEFPLHQWNGARAGSRNPHWSIPTWLRLGGGHQPRRPGSDFFQMTATLVSKDSFITTQLDINQRLVEGNADEQSFCHFKTMFPRFKPFSHGVFMNGIHG